MALKESFFAVDDGFSEIDAANDWYAQRFQAQSNYVLKYLMLSIYTGASGNPGTVTVSLQLDDGDEPDGTDINGITGTLSGAAIQEGTSNFAWAIFTLSADIPLTQNTKYWIVLRTSAGAASPDYLRWEYDNDDNGLGIDKRRAFSTDGGSSWSADVGLGYFFICTVLDPLGSNLGFDISGQVFLNGSAIWYDIDYTPSGDQVVNSIAMPFKAGSGSPGNITVSIQGDDAGKPDGTDIDGATATTDGDTLPAYWVFRNMVLSSLISLTGSTKYHIVIRGLSTDGSNTVSVPTSVNNTNVVSRTSADSGSTWGGSLGYDFHFLLFEEVTVEYDEGTKTVTGTGSASLVTQTYSDLSGFPNSRPSDYDEEKVWDEDAGAWVTADSSGGSRYQTQLVTIGYDDDGKGVIYYGDI